MNYYLIPMDFLLYNFEKMEQEYMDKGKIEWEIKGSLENSKYAKNIKCGDIVYFYIFNIESQSGFHKARILLRGVVCEEPRVMEKSEIYAYMTEAFDNIDQGFCTGFSIGKLTTLKKELLEKDSVFSYESIREKYEQKHPQGKFWPNKNDGSLNEELNEELEKNFKLFESKNDFKFLMDHFNRKCFFCGKLDRPHKHMTFKRGNGTDYFERHHFIKRNGSYTVQQMPALQDIINDDDNIICLCSNCHNQLHYGETQEIQLMIEKLCEDRQIQDMLEKHNFMKCIGVSNEQDAVQWIKEVYLSASGKGR